MKKTLREWFSYYEKKTHEKHVNPVGYKTVFDEEKGYCQFRIKDRDLLVYECCGDGLFWCNFAFNFAKKHDLERIVTICTRDIIPYVRRMGGHVVRKKERPNTDKGLDIYGVTKYGEFRCFPIWRNNKTERNAYCIVCEVKQ